ncbi:MAG: hypothetical protein LJF15_05340 [Acidobacteria bacterium]|jgi:hypothetical protein|nr:hypothetical protein [Acidobacteriota bacterium]
MSDDPKRLLGGYATDTLTDEERRELLRAALDDQELFDALVEDEGLRELLESPGARQELLDALEKPTAWERVRSWFKRPATFGDLATVVAVVLVVAVGYQAFRGTPDEGRPAVSQRPAATVSAATLEHLLALPPRQRVPASLELETVAAGVPPRVRLEEPLVLRASLQGPARWLLMAEREDGSAVQVYPPAGEPPAVVEAPASGGLAVRSVTLVAPSRSGPHRLRLVVAPVRADLGAAAPEDVEKLLPRLTLVDLTYEVINR